MFFTRMGCSLRICNAARKFLKFIKNFREFIFIVNYIIQQGHTYVKTLDLTHLSSVTHNEPRTIVERERRRLWLSSSFPTAPRCSLAFVVRRNALLPLLQLHRLRDLFSSSSADGASPDTRLMVEYLVKSCGFSAHRGGRGL